MIRCDYCGYRNDNRYYCAGCGHRGKYEKRIHAAPRPERELPFLTEIIAAMDRVFPPAAEGGVPVSPEGVSGIDLSRIAAADDVVIDGDLRLCFVKGPETARLFFGEIGMVTAVAFFFAVLTRVLGGLSLIASVKIYFIVFVGFSWAAWWFLPFAVGGTPIALVFGEMRLSRDGGTLVRGDLKTTMLLWLVSLGYSLFPLVFAEYLYFMVLRDHYQPLLFQVAGIRVARPV